MHDFIIDELELGARVALALQEENQMCIGCPDFVDMCAQDECFDPDGGPYGKFRKFHLGDTYCRHLQEFYGHPIAESTDYAIKYAYEHEDEAEA